MRIVLIAFCGVVCAASGRAQRITNVIPDAARPLPLPAVRLTGGPLKRAQDLNGEYLLKLEPDRMLAFYRQRAGLAAKAEPYAGWDGDGRNLTGHIAGHYLSAVSLMWAATGDPRFKERAEYLVTELKAVQDKQGDGYLGALAGGKETLVEVGKGNIRSSGFDLNGLWAPWYVLHKTFAGLRDAYRHTGNRTALDLEIKFAQWAERTLAQLTDAQIQRMLNTEFGGMNEVMADLYADTGDTRWLALSYRFEHRAVLDPLKRHEDRLSGLHGNTNVPKLLGSAVRFAYTGDPGDGFAAGFFWDRVARHHSFATGGHGKDEYFREPDKLGDIVDGRTAESCNVYNMLKLTRRLFALRPDAEYAEFHERALFNHVLGSMDPNDGSTCYMVPVGRGVRREYADMFRSFTCCVGSGMESHALHGHGIYYESGDRLWVNLFVPSIAEWKAAGAKIEMATGFPEGDSAVLTFTMQAPKPFTLALRRPSWAGDEFGVRVNGAAVADLPSPGNYVEITRAWKSGDTLAVTLPKALRLESMPDNRRRAAVMWGPLVLAGDLGPEPERGRGTRAPPPDVPMLVAAERPLDEWLKPVAGSPGSFRSDGVGRDRDVEFVPFYRLHRRTYAAYWDLFTPAEYEKKVEEITAERERQRKLDAATIAFLPNPAGDPPPGMGVGVSMI
ncbi:MAG: glycoside hydrolase family 127 protein [Acidobacteria bacterium]|nr:glycoside hydrolase family 127 protein [Acidobacteriota bacterium]